jgi:hypothetical protein
LKAVSTLSLLTNNIENGIDELCSFGVICVKFKDTMSAIDQPRAGQEGERKMH